MGIVGSYVMWTLPRGDEHIKGVQRIPVLLEFCSEWHHNPPPSTVDPWAVIAEGIHRAHSFRYARASAGTTSSTASRRANSPRPSYVFVGADKALPPAEIKAELIRGETARQRSRVSRSWCEPGAPH